MNLDPNFLGLLVVAMGAAVTWGGEVMARKALQRSHDENSKEFREAVSSLTGKVHTLERVQGGTDIRLDQIRGDIAEIKALLSPSNRRREPLKGRN
jgi:hypothetical protein